MTEDILSADENVYFSYHKKARKVYKGRVEKMKVGQCLQNRPGASTRVLHFFPSSVMKEKNILNK